VLVVDVLVEEVVTVLVVIQVVLTSETIGGGLPKLSVSDLL
jgi:hypothetical protein